MSDRAPIPNLPPISSIKDRDVRVALESMWNAWRVRNGDVGDGEHKFLTANDIKDALSTTTILRGSGGTLGSGTSSTGGVAPPNTSWIKPLLDKIDDYIQQSWLWKKLGERIDWIETPEWFIDKIDRSIGTSVKNEQKIREAADSSLASSISTVSAVLNNNIALVQEELTANVTLTEATATKVTTLQTEFDANRAQVQNSIRVLTSADQSLTSQINQAISDYNGQISGVKSEIRTVSNSVSALSQSTTTNFSNVNNNLSLIRTDVKSVTDLAGSNASKITTLQTSVAGVKTSAENALTLASTIEGKVNGAWTVKFDANGYVTGAGLGLEGKNGNFTSSFYVRADRFAIGNPQAPNIAPRIPFKVFTTTQSLPDGTQVPPGVYMDEAVVYKLTGTFIDAGTLNAGEIYSGSKYIDRSSLLQVPVVGLVTHTNGYVANVNASVYSDASLVFYGPAFHSSVPLRQRVRSSLFNAGSVSFTISCNANVEHYFSVHYRVNGGAWQYLFHAVENQASGGVYGSGIGPVSISQTVQMDIWQTTTVQFGVGIQNNIGQVWNMSDPENDIRDLSISVTTSNL